MYAVSALAAIAEHGASKECGPRRAWGEGQCAGGQSGSKEPINSRDISPSARGPSPPEVLSS